MPRQLRALPALRRLPPQEGELCLAESWSRDRLLAHAQVFSSRFVLEWSGVPVCRPTSLVSAQHWRQTLHAQSVVCSGDEAATSCSLRCVLDYVAVEEEQYK